jgi:uncharacterized membrane protein
MEAGDYSVKVSANGKNSVTEEISIATNEPFVKNFELN